MKNQSQVAPNNDASINRWLLDHEEIEDELGILTPQEDLRHEQIADDSEDDERIYHFR